MLDSKALVRLAVLLLQTVRALFRGRADLVMENLALGQQVAVLERDRPRPPLSNVDRMFWVALRRTWKHGASAWITVHPDTVVRWHRTGFRADGRLESRPRRAERRPVETKPPPNAQVVALPWVRGLHHRYEWRNAA